MLCTENKTWDVLNSNFSCNTLIYNTLSDIIVSTSKVFKYLNRQTQHYPRQDSLSK